VFVFVRFFCPDKHALAKRFDYLHNVIGYSHDAVVGWPQVLRTRTYIIRQRHEFLKLLRRDNFDSTRENYVSPKALATGRDVEFCDHVAKVSVKQFNDFLKTL
jgi:mTERF domain-containing protein